MRRALLAAAGCCAILVPTAAAANAPAAVTAIAPRAILFGDTLQAQLDVVVDDRADDPRGTRITTPLGAWTILQTRTAVSSSGHLVRRRLELTLVCRTAACVPAGQSATVRLPAPHVVVRTRGGRTTTLRVRWPSFVVASRLPADVTRAASPPFVRELTPPSVHAGAGRWAALFDVLAALLVLAAVALVVPVLLRRRRAEQLSPLEHALRLARQAQGRPAADRRRALELLHRVAPEATPDLAAAAWGPSDPEPNELARIVERLEEQAR